MFYAGYPLRAKLLDKDKETVLCDFGYRSARGKSKNIDQSISGLMIKKTTTTFELLIEPKKAGLFDVNKYVLTATGRTYKIIEQPAQFVNELSVNSPVFISLALE